MQVSAATMWITNAAGYGLLAAGVILIWFKAKRVQESFLFAKLCGYAFLAAFKFSINAFPLPVGWALAHVVKGRTRVNRTAKNYAILLGVGLFVLGLFPVQAGIEQWLYPRDQIATYMHRNLDPQTTGFNIRLSEMDGTIWGSHTEHSSVGMRLYQAIAGSVTAENGVGNRAGIDWKYRLEVHQDHADNRFRRLNFLVDPDGQVLQLEFEERYYLFQTNSAFQDVFKEIRPAADDDGGVLQQDEQDLDGDGAKERISLLYDGDLILNVDGQELTAYPKLDDPRTASPGVMGQKPKIFVARPVSGAQKAVLVSLVWSTNKIGSTVNMWGYRYRDERLAEVWSLDQARPEILSEYQGERLLTVRIPSVGLRQNLTVREEDYDRIAAHAKAGEGAGLRDEGLISPGVVTAYSIRNEPDGHTELVTRRQTYIENAPYGFYALYTFYVFREGRPEPFNAFFAEDMQRFILDRILQEGPFVLSEDSKETAYLLETGHAMQEIQTALQRMTDADILVETKAGYTWRPWRD